MMFRMRTTRSRKEISDQLLNLFSQDRELTLWQNCQIPRLQCRSLISDVDLEQNLFDLTPVKGEKDFRRISSHATLYLKSEGLPMVFKLENHQYHWSESKISFQIPSWVKIQELREESRYQVDGEGHFPFKVFKSVERGRPSSNSFNLKLLNLSRSGAGLEISQGNARFFKPGERMIISEIGHWKLPHKIQSEIVYLKEIRPEKGHSFFQIGVHFLTALSGKQMQRFI